jgi:hypothetical protein
VSSPDSNISFFDAISIRSLDNQVLALAKVVEHLLYEISDEPEEGTETRFETLIDLAAQEGWLSFPNGRHLVHRGRSIRNRIQHPENQRPSEHEKWAARDAFTLAILHIVQTSGDEELRARVFAWGGTESPKRKLSHSALKH